MVKYRNITINSSVMFTVCAILEMTLHEGAHFIASIIVGAKEVVLYHNYVSNNIDGLSVADIIFIKASGPNVSLLTGLIFHYLCFIQQSRNLAFLFNLYMAVFGYIGCLGYVMVSPFFVYGDTGYICYVLNMPYWLTMGIAILAAIILFLLMKNLTRYFVEMGTEEVIGNLETRPKFIHSLVLYPLLIGIVVTTLLNLPAPTFLSLIAPVCSPFTIMWTYGYALGQSYPVNEMNKNIHSIDKVDFLWIVVLLLVVNINRLLSTGFFI